MIRSSSSFVRPVFTSASTPRSLKIATAAGDKESEIKTLGMCSPVLHLLKGPIEPGRQRLQIRSIDGRAAPNAQSRRRRTITANVQRDALLLEHAGDLCCGRGLRVFRKRREPGIDNLQTHAGVGPRARIL